MTFPVKAISSFNTVLFKLVNKQVLFSSYQFMWGGLNNHANLIRNYNFGTKRFLFTSFSSVLNNKSNDGLIVDDQIKTVEKQIKSLEEEIKTVDKSIFETKDVEIKKYWMNKEQQLRDKENKLNDRLNILLKNQQQVEPCMKSQQYLLYFFVYNNACTLFL